LTLSLSEFIVELHFCVRRGEEGKIKELLEGDTPCPGQCRADLHRKGPG
jgi:hypothetical protein